ncbi:MAG: SsrA-binding protein [Flavobacteriales bacterium]|nr:SsrA-binding protein [Flavobacteriales bacterium]|tara:strand:- start:12877 stop:13323 length:447 start_codon:yes stop_codon:yes gene_type:complete
MKDINIKNKRARFEYQIIDTFIAGIKLYGTEIKSIRLGKALITDSFCTFKKNELWIRGMHITEYEFGTYTNHEPKRERKLLLNRLELEKIQKKLKDQGLTIVPLRLFITEKGWAKLEIAIAKGKKLHDKRDSLKEKDTQRDIDRAKRY